VGLSKADVESWGLGGGGMDNGRGGGISSVNLVDRNELYRVVAESNRVLLGMGWRVGVLEGKQRVKYSTKSLSFLGGGEAGAWIDVEAGLIWDKMRDEFELVPR